MVKNSHLISESLIQNEKNEKREKISLEITGKFREIDVNCPHLYPSLNPKYQEFSKGSLNGDESSGESSSVESFRASAPPLPPRKKCSGTLRILSLILALCMCASGCHIMWNTDLFNVMVHQNLILRNNSLRYEAWEKLPVHANLRLYLFNYTNVEEYEKGIDSKLKLEEVGPYTYVETIERINVKFNDDGTITYQDKKSYTFSEELSVGSEMDLVTVPNMPFLGTIALAKDYNMFARLTLSGILNHMKARPFIQLPVGEFLWGYEEDLSRLASKILAIQHDVPFTKFGILAGKNDTIKDIVTIHTGERDLSKIGVVSKFNGEDSLSYWNSQDCNRIDGTDGTVYPPSIITKHSSLQLYTKDMCRRVPLEYESQYIDKHGIPILRFQLPEDIFDNEAEKNRCFCTAAGEAFGCLPSGVFNASPCAYGAPIVTSLPHFLYGEKILFEDLEGLKPEKEKHQSYVEVDPKIGAPTGGYSRLQLNIMLHQTTMITALSSKYRDGLILPIAWMGYGVDKLPDDLRFLILSLSYTVRITEAVFSYGSIIFLVIISYLLIKHILRLISNRRYFQNIKLSSTQIPLFLPNQKT